MRAASLGRLRDISGPIRAASKRLLSRGFWLRELATNDIFFSTLAHKRLYFANLVGHLDHLRPRPEPAGVIRRVFLCPTQNGDTLAQLPVLCASEDRLL
jgi:hypothetical protein